MVKLISQVSEHTATHYNTLTHTCSGKSHKSAATHCNALQHTAIHYNTLTHTWSGEAHKSAATHCNTLQYTVIHYNTLLHTWSGKSHKSAATHCNTTQHTAIHYNTLKHTWSGKSHKSAHHSIFNRINHMTQRTRLLNSGLTVEIFEDDIAVGKRVKQNAEILKRQLATKSTMWNN